MKAFKLFGIVAIAIVILSSCNGGDDKDVVQNYLVDYQLFTPKVKFDVESTKTLLQQNNMGAIAEKVQYDVQIFKITYKTRFEGDTVYASGVVAIPVPENKKEAFPVLSYQHGTIVRKADAPSVNTDNEFMTYMASTGMVVAIPDYIGFGETSDVFHPFMIKEYTNNAVLDMIRAAKELVGVEKAFDLNGNLFMYGYSQGGSATLGALSAIENNAANSDLNVTAAACGAGAYNLNDMRNWIVKQSRYEQPYFIAYILNSYTRYAGLDTSYYGKVFSPEFAAMIPDMIDGVTTADELNAEFGTFHKGELLNDNFEEDSTYNADYTELIAAFDNNKIDAWPIATSLSIHYGSEDVWVPGDQSLNLFKQFQNNGSGARVKLERFEGLNHETTFTQSLTKALTWFLSFS